MTSVTNKFNNKKNRTYYRLWTVNNLWAHTLSNPRIHWSDPILLYYEMLWKVEGDHRGEGIERKLNIHWFTSLKLLFWSAVFSISDLQVRTWKDVSYWCGFSNKTHAYCRKHVPWFTIDWKVFARELKRIKH